MKGLVMFIVVMALCAFGCFYMDKIQKRQEKEYSDTFNNAFKEVKDKYLEEKERADNRTKDQRERVKVLHDELGTCCDDSEFERKMIELDRLNCIISRAYSYLDTLHPWNSFRMECIVRTGKDLHKRIR